MKRFFFFGIILLFFVIPVPNVLSQSRVDNSVWDRMTVTDLNKVVVADANAKYGEIEFHFKLSLFFWIVVLVSGLATTVLGIIFRNPKTPTAIVIVVALLGVIIAFSSTLEQTLLGVNFKSMRGFRDQARSFYSDMNARLSVLKDPLTDSIWYQDFKDKYNSLVTIHDQFMAARDAQVSTSTSTNDNVAENYLLPSPPFFSFGRKLYAQDLIKEPGWVSSPQLDKTNLYFRGKGTSFNYQEAHALAYEDAKAQAIDYIKKAFIARTEYIQSQLDSLSAFLLKNAIIVSKYSSIPSASSSVTTYILLEIPIAKLDTLLNQFQINNLYKFNPDNINIIKEGLKPSLK